MVFTFNSTTSPAFLTTGGQLDTGPLGVGVMCNNLGVVARAAGKPATVTSLLLQVADNGTLRHASNGQYIAHLKVGLPSSVDELASVHALSSQEDFLVNLVTVWVTEVDYC